MTDKPKTPTSTLLQARDIAINLGINFCYVGNIHHDEGQTTYCPNCGSKLIERDWHSVLTNNIKNGMCKKCKTTIPGIF